MLTNSMAIKLIDFYTKDTKHKVKRKQVKIIVDSLIEQLCNDFLKKCPDDIVNIRKKINLAAAESNGLNKDILKCFDQVLRSYDEIFSKSYSDHTDNFNKFLDKEFKELILGIVKYNYIKDVKLSKQLRELL